MFVLMCHLPMQVMLCFMPPVTVATSSRVSTQTSSFVTSLTSKSFHQPRRKYSKISTPPPQMSSEESKSRQPEDRNDGRAAASLFGLRARTNGDVIKFGIAAIVFVYAFKTGLQLLGTPDLLAGQLTTGFVSVLSLLIWVSTYVFRVGTKGMTYAQQLRDYEDAVIKKRYEELTEEELVALKEELDDDE